LDLEKIQDVSIDYKYSDSDVLIIDFTYDGKKMFLEIKDDRVVIHHCFRMSNCPLCHEHISRMERCKPEPTVLFDIGHYILHHPHIRLRQMFR